MSAYLFIHFTSDRHHDDETIRFSLSRDGLNWTDLGNGEPVIVSDKGTKGIRDPFIVYDENKKKYFIIATDLNTNDGGNWDDYSHRGSRNILIWESEDLIHFSDSRLVPLAVEGSGCAWAPEAVYCRENGKWLVFWASCIKLDGDDDYKQRIYAAFTEDFVSFEPTFLYIDPEHNIIDTDIVYSDGYYYRASKNETTKIIFIDRCKHLVADEANGEKYERIFNPALDNYPGLEGPVAYYIEQRKEWCLLVDQFGIGAGYLPLVSSDWSKGDFRILDKGEYSLGKHKKRHGGILPISDEMADKLVSYYGLDE